VRELSPNFGGYVEEVMDLLRWNKNYTVGLRVIDEQHKRLFVIINDLIVAFNEQQDRQVYEKIFVELIAFTKYHFLTEKKFIKTHPQYNEHVSLHENFFEEVSEFIESFHIGEEERIPEMLEFLINWVDDHVLNVDMIYFRELGYHTTEIETAVPLLTPKQTGTQILVVDDSSSQRELLRIILEADGYEVFTADCGEAAMHICQTQPDLRLVITDLHMPGMDGFQLIKNIRQEQVSYMYILVLTSMTATDTIVQALSMGANDVIYKPVRPDELKLRLRSGRRLLCLEIQDELIFSMAKLADYRSEETGLHLNRVQEYSFALGKYLAENYPEMGVSLTVASEIAKVSPLHDIGKVGIADNILGKPALLNQNEFQKMTLHTVIGGDLIGDIHLKTGTSRMRLAFEVTMYHHERWDGTGYPAGLSEDGIPVAARIVALADVYDALPTERVYKNAFDHEEAKMIIAEEKGSHFDPRIVESFFALENEFEELKEKLKDNNTMYAN